MNLLSNAARPDATSPCRRKRMGRALLQALLLGCVGFYSISATADSPENPQGAEIDSLRLNQLQVIGSHNSFKAAIEPQLFEMMVAVVPDAEGLQYAHPSLTDQLNLGLRGLELDLYHDPEGGRYARPLGLTMLRLAGKEPEPYDPDGKMLEPGFKVLHVHDIDFRSNCYTLADALAELRRWSDLHPRHLPVVITFNLTDDPIQLPGSVQPLRFDRAALDTLDEQLQSTLGKEKLILPDQVRGDHETLEAAVKASGWPTLGEARGRFLLVLDDFGRKRADYLVDHPALRGRIMFVNSTPGQPEAAVMIRNHPRTEGEAIRQLVRQGFLVRTRADAGTQEARKGDLSRFEAAQKSGAQIISTDYYLADWRLKPSYRIRFDEGSCWRPNPVTGNDEQSQPKNLTTP